MKYLIYFLLTWASVVSNIYAQTTEQSSKDKLSNKRTGQTKPSAKQAKKTLQSNTVTENINNQNNRSVAEPRENLLEKSIETPKEKQHLQLEVEALFQLDTLQSKLLVNLEVLKKIFASEKALSLIINSKTDSIYFQAEGYNDTSITKRNIEIVDIRSSSTTIPWYESLIFWIPLSIYIGLPLLVFFLYRFIYLPHKKESGKQYLEKLTFEGLNERLRKDGMSWEDLSKRNKFFHIGGQKILNNFKNMDELKEIMNNKAILFTFVTTEILDGFDKNSGYNNDVGNRLQGIEENIKMLLAQDQNANKINELTRELQKKEQVFQAIETKLKEKEIEIKDKQSELADIKKNDKAQAETIGKQQEIINYFSDKIISVPHLQNIGRSYDQYLELLQSVPITVNDFYNECLVIEKDSLNTEMVRKMIEKYNISTLPMISAIGKWVQIANLLKNTGCISDDTLCQKLGRESLSQDEQKKLFREYFFRDLLNPYINSTMMLAEEISLLGKFSNIQDQRSKSANHKFKPIVTQLLQQARADANLEINYLPLFESYEKYAEFVREVDDEPSNLYQNLQGLNRNDVIEVKSYGFKKINGFEVTETKVIIKK